MKNRRKKALAAARRRAFLVGLGSLIDIRGEATYEAMQDLMPDADLKPMGQLYQETRHLMVSTPR